MSNKVQEHVKLQNVRWLFCEHEGNKLRRLQYAWKNLKVAANNDAVENSIVMSNEGRSLIW